MSVLSQLPISDGPTSAVSAALSPAEGNAAARRDSAEALAQCPIFALLDDDARNQIAQHIVVEQFAAGEVIFHEGDAPRWLFIVVEGLVKLIKHSDDGRDIILHLAMPHDLIGGVSAFGRRPHPFTASAMQVTSVLRFAGEDYAAIMDAQSTVARRTLDDLIERLTEAHEMMKSLAVERVERRVAGQLYRLAARAGRPAPSGIVLDLPLTRRDLADMAGTTVELAIRVLSRWRADGVVATPGGRIIICDEARLGEIAGIEGE